jgi:hypothetical protein
MIKSVNFTPPIKAIVKGKIIKSWVLDKIHSCADNATFPISPISSNYLPKETVDLTLIPFGNTRLRLGSFPFYFQEPNS